MNSVQLEVLKLDKQWYREIKNSPQSPLYVCLGEKHELRLLEGYFKSQSSDQAKTKDLFLILYHPFEGKNQYGTFMVERWHELHQAGLQTRVENLREWQEVQFPEGKYKTDAYQLLQTLESYYHTYPEMEGRKIFLLLQPPNLKEDNAQEWEEWIGEWCRINRKKKDIKLVIKEYKHLRTFKNLPPNTHEVVLNIDGGKLMQNAAQQTQREKGNPEMNFQQQILNAYTLLGEGKYEPALHSLDRALFIAKKDGSQESEATARFIRATVFTALEDKKNAKAEFEKLFQTVEKDTLFAAQIHFHYAGFLLSQSETTAAIQELEKALTIGEKIEDYFIQLESHRMLGQFKDGMFNSSQALAHYEKCLEIGAQLPLQERKASTFPYTMRQLLKKYGKSSEKGKKLDQKMKQLVGENWQEKVNDPEPQPTN
ncbi:tetratricopeptide repeat protein [Apibacter muscae]|nr:tetratricopeptide repeat protein [Apibacter muscae]TWP31365.1 tetratricopeptide repeat protein [Apibacter muscae]